MKYYSYEEFFKDVNKIAREVKPHNFDALLAVARGGLTFGHFLAHAIDTRNLYSLNSVHYEESQKLDYIKISNIPDLSNAKKVLIIDDIADSGETLVEVKRVIQEKFPNIEDIKIATIFYKDKSIIKPDFYTREATEWIEFCWDFKI
ncbi:MAG: phosphoribosyltransferase [Campylobacteraceae bacterium]